jgi:uncharacterized membrane protein YeiH
VDPTPFVVALEYVGVVAFAISGALLAEHKRMDLVGVVVFATVVSVGGGTIRDILLGQLPVFWIDDPIFIVVGAMTALITLPLAKSGTIDLLRRFRIISLADAAGLAAFTVLGTSMALEVGASDLAAISVGMASGIGGGVVRDVLASRVPEALSDGRLYATAALMGALTYVVLLELGLSEAVTVWAAIAVIFGIRLLSIGFGVRVPTVTIPEQKIGTRG